MGLNLLLGALFLLYHSTAGVKLIEEDIVLDSNVMSTITGLNKGYDGIVRGHWPGGVVPYTFSQGFDSARRSVAHKAIAEYNKYTCVRFVPRTNQRAYVQFMVGGGCYSSIGKTGGYQQLSIGNGCNSKGIVMHEMMHAIGFYHEQSRLDRDDYVTIHWGNIYPQRLSYNFQKYRHGVADYFGEPYDYDSLMHYSKTAFGRGRVTISAKGNTAKVLGQRNGFSRIDVRQINKMYKCSGTKPTPPAITKPPCVDRNRQCKEWAQYGSCSSNPSYMKAYCPESCGLCRGGKTSRPVTRRPVTRRPVTRRPVTTKPTGHCVDTYHSCASLVRQNYCSLHPVWVLQYCKRSCNKCNSVRCVDSQRDCPAWARAGHCRSNPNYMKSFCKKSCRVC